MNLMPTPTARLGRTGGNPERPGLRDARNGAHGVGDLADVAALLPTPRTNDMRGPGVRGDGGLDLRTAVSLMQVPDAPRAGRQLLPTPTRADGERRSATYARGNPTLVGALLPTPAARDWRSGESNIMDRNARPLNEVIVNLLPTPMAADGGSDRASSAGFGLHDASRKIPDQWGTYAPAIARWEAVTDCTAPSPTEPGAKGRPRLSPPFVEWLMGLPAGWVTEHLGRGQALKCLGNGVVWQQAAHAYAELLVAS